MGEKEYWQNYCMVAIPYILGHNLNFQEVSQAFSQNGWIQVRSFLISLDFYLWNIHGSISLFQVNLRPVLRLNLTNWTKATYLKMSQWSIFHTAMFSCSSPHVNRKLEMKLTRIICFRISIPSSTLATGVISGVNFWILLPLSPYYQCKKATINRSPFCRHVLWWLDGEKNDYHFGWILVIL